jgi:hypothetical protein
MEKRKVFLVRSETWLEDNYKDISKTLEETIKEFVKDERIINIEVKEHCGLKRFWIYLENK